MTAQMPTTAKIIPASRPAIRTRVPVSSRGALEALTAISVHAHQPVVRADIRAMGTHRLTANRIRAKVTTIA